nr:hypothetical protein [Tanacetum cinerariifolium]
MVQHEPHFILEVVNNGFGSLAMWACVNLRSRRVFNRKGLIKRDNEKVKALGDNGVMSGSKVRTVWMEVVVELLEKRKVFRFDEFMIHKSEVFRKTSKQHFIWQGKFEEIFDESDSFCQKEELDQQNLTLAKIPILETGKFEQWQFRIQQYLQHEHYALWEVIEFRDSYEVPKEDAASASDSAAKKEGKNSCSDY